MSVDGARVRVLVYLRIDDAGADAVLDAYHEISESLTAVDGLIGNELLLSPIGGSAAVMSEWKSLRHFTRWEEGASHRTTTSALRKFQDRKRTRVFDVFEVAAEHR